MPHLCKSVAKNTIMQHRFDISAPGCKLASCSISYASLTAGTMSMAFLMDDLADIPVPWLYGDWVSVYRGKELVFMGTVKRACPKVESGSFEFIAELSDAYDVMLQTTYTRTEPTLPGCGPLKMGKTTTSPKGGSSLRQILKEATGAAKHLPGAVDVQADAMIGTFSTNGSNTCAQLIEAASRWCPGLVSWFDYSGEAPRLVFADSLDLPILDIPYTDCLAIDLRPRHDLVPPVVALKAPDGTIITTIPEGADILTPGAFVYTLPAAEKATADTADELDAVEAEKPGAEEEAAQKDSGSASPEKRQLMEFVGVKLPEDNPTGAENEWQQDDRAFRYWQHHFPFLAQKDLKPHVRFSKFSRITFDALPDEYKHEDPVTGEETWDLPRNYDVRGQKYELIRGNISDKTPSVSWCYATVEQLVCCTPSAPRKASVREFFPGDGFDASLSQAGVPARVITKRLYYRVIAISRSGGKYRIGGDYGDVSVSTPEEEAAKDANSTPAEVKEHGDYVFRNYVVNMPDGGELILRTSWFDAVMYVYWGDGGVTGGKQADISRSRNPSQEMRHTYAPGVYSLKLAIRENEGAYFTPHNVLQEVEGEVPTDLIRNYWDKTRALQWDGSVSLFTHPAPWQLPGHRLRITGADYEPWATMDTTIQAVQVDAMTGKVSLTLGTREHITFSEISKRASVADLRDQSLATETACDPTAMPSSGGGGGGAGGDDQEENPVSPIFAPMDSGSSGGERRRPFSMYFENNSWYMAEGKLPVPGGGTVTIPRTLIPSYDAAYTYFHVLYRKPSGEWSWKLKKQAKKP